MADFTNSQGYNAQTGQAVQAVNPGSPAQWTYAAGETLNAATGAVGAVGSTGAVDSYAGTRQLLLRLGQLGQ